MIFNKGDFYPMRDGTRSPYLIGQFKDITKTDAVILLMKNLNYPFIIDDWYYYIDSGLTSLNPVGKYIGLMNLPAYRSYRFEDSKHFNQYSQHLKRLYKEVDRTIYDEVVDILPELEIKTEEIKSNTLKKPAYFIAYDENDKPIMKLETIKDVNITTNYDTIECKNAKGITMGQWTSNKGLDIAFTYETLCLLPEEEKKEEKTNYELEIDKFIKELNL